MTRYEPTMDKIMRMHARTPDMRSHFKDLGDQGISRAKNYLVKVCGLSEAFETKAWHAARMFLKGRNLRVGVFAYTDDDTV